MGNISSRPDDGAALCLREPHRFSMTSLSIVNAKQRPFLSILPNAFPASRAVARRDSHDESPIEYILDADGATYPSFLLRLSNAEELNFNFSLVVRQNAGPSNGELQAGTDTIVNGLTFVFAPSTRELDALVTREFSADPNFHKNPNVELVRPELSTNGVPSVQLDYSWKWRPPKSAEDKGGGWRNVCAFVEYDQRAHKLNTLASFSFWVQNSRPSPSTQLPSPQYDMLGPPRIRVASSQSAHSVLSDSEGPNEKDLPSPVPEIEPSVPLTQSSTSNAVVDVACQRPGEVLSVFDDGPLFRATMKALEQKTGNMKGRMKKLLKKAGAAQVAQAQCNEAMAQFLDALRDTAASNANAIQPALEHYFEKIARQILKYENENSTNLQKLIIDPLSKLYNIDIKQAESKKRDFEEESKEYYSYVGRYLGQRQDSLKEKKRVESDSKYQNKRRDFELKRFDYSSFMQDLHGGRKEQEVLSHLTRYADTQTKSYLATGKTIEEMVPQLDALIREVGEVDKEFRIQRTEREEKRRTLERSTKSYVETDSAFGNGATNGLGVLPDTEPSKAESTTRAPLQHSNSTTSQPGSVPASNTLAPSNSLKSSAGSPATSPGQERYRGIREADEKENGPPVIGERTVGPQRKEGLLWALSRPGSLADPRGLNKQAWHKYWIVLDQGKLSEYSNWKERLDLHMEPIDLRLASVREARNSERRFCFEVITPNFKRVYQATSEDDMTSWIGAINNAVQSAFEARSQPQSFDPSPTEASLKRDIGSVLTGKSPTHNMKDPLSYYSPSNYNPTNSGSVYRRITVGARPSYTRTNSSSYDENPKKLLQEIRDRDEGNLSCADCSSKVNTDWVSINLGIVLCIECSGIHRSLGTHVSKIRSLTLDTVSFTVDIVELIMAIGNSSSNRIWEARLDPANKPNPSWSWDDRRQFVTDKYVRRSYVSPISTTVSAFGTPDETLIASIKRNDILQVLYALALRANPDATDKSRNTHAVFLALAAADPASPHASPPIPLGAAGAGARPTAFPVAELLLQNGGEIPRSMPAFPLSVAAQQYFEQKRAKETVAALPQIRNAGAPAEKERERLQKRTSAGARFNARSVGL